MKKEEKDFFDILGNRLQDLRKKYLKISVEKLAEDIGVSVNQVRKYEQGRDRISLNILVKLGKKYNIPVDYFYAEKVDIGHFLKKDQNIIPSLPCLSESQARDLGIDQSKYQTVPVYSFAGAGKFVDLTKIEPIDTLLIPNDFYKKSLGVVKVVGPSMEPIIKNGSYVGVDLNCKEITSGMIYCVNIDYEGVAIKYVFKERDGFKIKSENPKFDDIFIKKEEINDSDHFVIGRVVWVWQNI